jgi:hypothetical protein
MLSSGYQWTFSSVLVRQDLDVADSFYLPWYEPYKHALSLSHLLCYQCLEVKASPVGYTFLQNFSLKGDSFQQMNIVSSLLHSICMQITIHE